MGVQGHGAQAGRTYTLVGSFMTDDHSGRILVVGPRGTVDAIDSDGNVKFDIRGSICKNPMQNGRAGEVNAERMRTDAYSHSDGAPTPMQLYLGCIHRVFKDTKALGQ